MAQTALANDNEDQLRAQLSALQPPRAPQLAPVPAKAPPPIIADPLKAMSGPMMLLATLGGALTGAPITSALNNATGFLKGVAYGNDYVSQQHLKEFNANVNAATKANQTAVDQYKLDLLQYQNDAGRLHQALLSTAVSHGDDMVKALLESGDVKSAVTLIDARQRAAEMLQLHKDSLALANQRLVASSFGQPQMVYLKDGTAILGQQDRAGVLGQAGKWYTADENHTPIGSQSNPIVGAVSATTAGNPSASEGMAALIANYSAPPLTGYALRTPSGQQVMADVKKINPDYNANLYATVGKTMQAFSVGPQGTRLASINVAIQHLDVLGELAHALHTGNTQAINAANQAFQKQFGQPAPTNFDSVQTIVGQEVVKAIVTAGGGEAERQAAANTFARRLSPQQMAGAIESVERLLAGQVAGLRQQYEANTSAAPGVVPFDKFLLPRTKQVLGELPNQGSAAAPSGNSAGWSIKEVP